MTAFVRGKTATSNRDYILARVTVDPDTGCWIWQSCIDQYGYAKARRGGDRAGHRLSYATFVGVIPDGLQIDHLCRVKSCVNPQHLEPVTLRENMMRRWVAVRPFQGRIRDHCKKGHPYAGSNLYITPTGKRDCRACRKEASRRYQARRAL